MSKEEVILILKKRVSVQKLDIYMFFESYFFSLAIGIIFGLKFFTLFILCLYPWIYFALLPYLTSGYTVAGWLFGVRIVEVLDGKCISLLTYTKRIFYDIKLYLKKEKYSVHSRFPLVKWYEINTLGQYKYDELLGIKAVVSTQKITESKPLEYFTIEDLEKKFDMEFKKRWRSIRFLLFFAFGLLTTLIYKIMSI